MGNFIVNCKEDASDADIADAKKSIEAQGGTIKDSFTLIKGFSASFPEDHVGTLSKHKAVDVVEADGEMKTHMHVRKKSDWHNMCRDIYTSHEPSILYGFLQ